MHPNRAAFFRQLTGDDDLAAVGAAAALCDAKDGLPASQAFTKARNAARRGLAQAGHGTWFGAVPGR
jgi:hypothetical protein